MAQETVQAAAERILAQLGPYHTEDVYRNAMRVALKDAASETVAFHYDGQRVGTQLLGLVWRRYIVEVECLAAQSAHSAYSHHDTCFLRARTCRRDVLLVKFSPSGVRVVLYAAPEAEPKPKVTLV